MTVSVKAPTSTTGSIQLNGSDVLTIDSSGNLTAPNSLTSTGGIYLGGTASANLLDDYEYGTWTPNVYHSSSNNSTWTQKQGRYVKIGDQVTCWFLCDSGNSGTSGSDLRVGTLPFTTGDGNANIPYGTCGIWGANGLSPQDGSVFMLVSSNTLKIYHGGGAITTGTSYISGTFTYRIQP